MGSEIALVAYSKWLSAQNESTTVNHWVGGSSRSQGAKIIKGLAFI